MARKGPPVEEGRGDDRDRAYASLVEFQVERLLLTYRDLRENPRYEHISEFFFNDVYSTRDKSERDDQFKRLYETFRRRFGEQITRGVGELVALNDLSDALDWRMVEALVAMKTGDPLTDEEYEEAYRRCDNHDTRVLQIEMLVRTIRHFRALAGHATIGLALMAVKAGAALFGGHTVIGFLDRGYHAYRSVTPAENEHFVTALEEREMARLDRIYRRRDDDPWRPVRSQRER